MKNSKISMKFLKIIIYITILTLLVSMFISYFILKDIQTDTQTMVKNNIGIKIQNKINNSLQLGITNAIALSENSQLKQALVDKDKQKAYDLLNKLSKIYIKSSDYNKPKVHIHTSDIRSFLRSWDRDHNGDNLKEFRHTINKVKQTKKPVLGIEVGWADLVIRGIVPLMDKDKYIGSLEFIQDFSSIQKSLEKENKHLLSLIDIKLLKNIPSAGSTVDNFALLQKEYDTESFSILKNLNFNELINSGYIKEKGKFFSIKQIKGFNNSFIGYYVIVQDAKNIQNIISKFQEIAFLFIGLMIFMTIVMILILNNVVKKLITDKLTKVSSGLISFFDYLNKKTDTVEKIEVVSHDEIGQMAVQINENIDYIKTLIEKENQEKWIKEGLSRLNKHLSSLLDKVEISNGSVSFLCEYLSAGVGAFYLFEDEQEKLKLEGSYAFVNRNSLSNIFELGEGTVGQVALQKTPILLQNIERSNVHIITGTTDEPPINTYTYPLIYQEELYGVIEIGSTKLFTQSDLQFIELSSGIIATAIFSAIKNEKVKELLKETEIFNDKLKKEKKITEKSNKELQKQQIKLEEANSQMQEQQAELEEANSQMQEQQAQLEEANAQMEEQQVQLRSSQKELTKQNKILENSKNELNDKADALEESNKYKSEFLANMSHELRTPLNSIILLSSMLKENKFDNLKDEDIKKANIINNSGHELLRLINDVLDLSKIEAGKMELNVDDFNSNDFANEIKDMFEISISNKGLEFIVEDRYNNIIKNDRDKLSQIVRNFISNSLKFTKEGFIKFVIDTDNDNKIKVYVQDTGIGIDQKKLSVIFDAFTQADGSTSRKYGGTGLGLSITKQFSNLMGGDVSVESKEGEGSIFTIVFPSINQDNEIDYSQQEQIVSNIDDDREKIVESSKPFLVIEDNETFASILKESINEKGDLAIIETTGRGGLRSAKEFHHIQGILLDLGLPDIDGIEVLKELKSDIHTKSIPVYIISGKQATNRIDFKEAVGYKQKPLSNDDFISVFKELEEYHNKQMKNLLIVEENKQQRESMIAYLAMDSVNIIETGNMKEAIKSINENEIDAIVVDPAMENKSTLEVCEYIKNNNLDIPVIVYTTTELTKEQEDKIKQYTTSIVVKSDKSNDVLKKEVEGFLHRVKNNNKNKSIATSAFDLKDKKILVADDDMRNTFILVELLEDKNAQVITASNGKEALEQLNKNTDVDLILMDIMMPVMDGYEAIEIIKKDNHLKDIPIIALTAKAMQQDKHKCLEIGADDFLTKPLNIDTFTGVISSWIN